MSKSFIGSIVLILSATCFINCETSVKVTAPQKNPGEFGVETLSYFLSD